MMTHSHSDGSPAVFVTVSKTAYEPAAAQTWVGPGPVPLVRLSKLHGAGMVHRVRELAGGALDFALHTAQVKSTLPEPVKIVDGDPKRVLSFADFDEDGLGVRTTGKGRGGITRS